MAPDTLPAEAAYAALQTRDARFDGRLFVGVTSTGIYCRPVCRVRCPRRENCRFFATAAQAEAQRFRPCMKCRPELAPRPLAWTTADASRTLATQAAEWLDACDEPQASVEVLARHLGITSRHLRRIFQAEHGVSPLQYLQTRRLLLAKNLLTDSRMPIHEVAFAAGFASLRRFNAAFVEQYRLQPSVLRRERPRAQTACGEPALRLAYRPPYAVAAVLEFLAARAIPGVERVDPAGRRIRRSVVVEHQGQRLRGRIELRFDEAAHEVLLSPCSRLWPASGALIAGLRRWLDLDAEPERIDAHLGALAEGTPGLRLPGCLDRFELAVRAVLGQQITVAAARTLAGRFVAHFGEPLVADERVEGVEAAFPTPDRVAAASRDDIASLGIIGRRAEALVALARHWPGLAFAQGRGTPDEALAELCALPGIGPWTASYMLMRGWSWPDAFPPNDVVLRKALSEQPGGDGTLVTPKAYLAAAEPWRPFRSYAVLHLWRNA